MKVALGIGCDHGTPATTIAQAVDQALAQIGATADEIERIASIDLKADEAGLLEFAAARQQRIVFYPAAELAQVVVPNPSETVRKYTGTPSVSEAAALLVASGYGRSPLPSPDGATSHSTKLASEQVAGYLPQAGEGDKVSLREFLDKLDTSALLVEKFKLRGPDGRNTTVSIARIST